MTLRRHITSPAVTVGDHGGYRAEPGTGEIGEWCAGDRVEYADPSEVDDQTWDRVKELLSRRGLRLVDDGAGYVVCA